MTSLKTVFGIDLRSLALFRMGLGFCILLDLAGRAQDLRAHYSDEGVLPRADLAALGQSSLSLHLLSGAPWVEAVLFGIAACAALTLFVGLRTRLATFVSWALLASLISRNKLLVQGGDNLLLLLLFWGLFLPLGARYSLDAACAATPRKSSAFWSMATTALLVQMMLVFVFSALLKTGKEWIPDGTAIAYALHLDYFARPLGAWLRDFPSLTHAMTYYVWYLELLAPLLIFSPFAFEPLRWMALGLLATLHLGIAATLNVGLFPLINLVGLVVFLPPSFWRGFERRLQGHRGAGTTLYYDGDCTFCRTSARIVQVFLLLKDTRALPSSSVGGDVGVPAVESSWVVEDETGQRHTRWDAFVALIACSPFAFLAKPLGGNVVRRAGGVAYRAVTVRRRAFGRWLDRLCPGDSGLAGWETELNWAAGGLMVYVVIINLQTLPGIAPQWGERLARVRDALKLNQRWDMFTPAPPKMNVWFYVRGELAGGGIVDVLDGTPGEPRRERSVDASRYYPTFRWEKYLSRLALPQYRAYRPAYAEYLCRRWNELHPEAGPLRRLWLYVATESNELHGAPPRGESLLLLVHACTAGP